MAAPKQARTRPAAMRGGGGAKSRNKGTRGGRPEPLPAAATGPVGGGQGRRDPDARLPGGRGGEALTPAGPVPGTPRWLRLTTLVLSLGGLGMSVYLTIAHYTSASILACPGNGVFNCGLVTTSPESVVFGIFPVAVLGLAFFVAMTAITSPWAWRAPWPWVRWARLGSVVAGMAFVLYLIYTELITLDHVCVECTSVHVITFLLFCLIVFSSVTVAEPAPAEAGR